jgi:hypothetical protein
VARLEEVLGARVHGVTVQRLDLVDDVTVVDVRYQVLDRTAVPVELAADRRAEVLTGVGR